MNDLVIKEKELEELKSMLYKIEEEIAFIRSTDSEFHRGIHFAELEERWFDFKYQHKLLHK